MTMITSMTMIIWQPTARICKTIKIQVSYASQEWHLLFIKNSQICCCFFFFACCLQMPHRSKATRRAWPSTSSRRNNSYSTKMVMANASHKRSSNQPYPFSSSNFRMAAHCRWPIRMWPSPRTHHLANQVLINNRKMIIIIIIQLLIISSLAVSRSRIHY